MTKLQNSQLKSQQQSAHAQSLLDIALGYATNGGNVALAAMAGATECVEFRHYPLRDVVDRQNRTRFFYHAHGSRRRPPEEHGHFHIFGHGDSPADYFHLVGISLDARGFPNRLFTTNRWVTGERWRSAAEVEKAIAGFQLTCKGRLAPVARWISALLNLYEPQIKKLVKRRDAVMRRRSQKSGWDALCEDRKLDVVTQCKLNLPEKVQQLVRC